MDITTEIHSLEQATELFPTPTKTYIDPRLLAARRIQKILEVWVPNTKHEDWSALQGADVLDLDFNGDNFFSLFCASNGAQVVRVDILDPREHQKQPYRHIELNIIDEALRGMNFKRESSTLPDILNDQLFDIANWSRLRLAHDANASVIRSIRDRGTTEEAIRWGILVSTGRFVKSSGVIALDHDLHMRKSENLIEKLNELMLP